LEEGRLFSQYGQVIPPGTVIFREGDDGEQMFIIQSGKIRIGKSIGGKEHILAVLGKGEFFGETAIVSRIKRTATATAVSETRLLAFDRREFQSMIEKNIKIAMNVIDKLCRRLIHANRQIQYLKRKDVAGLVAVNLLHAFEESDLEGTSVPLDHVLEEISLSLEVPAEEVAGIIDGFRREGLVIHEEGKLGLRDRDGLRSRAESP